jgi:hypothetical protein
MILYLPRTSSPNVALFHPKDEGNMLLSNIGKYLPAETTKHHRTLASSTILREPQILLIS